MSKLTVLVDAFTDVWDSVSHALKTKEQYAPYYEDNVNAVAGVIQKPIVTSQYSPLLSTTAITPATAVNAKQTQGQVLAMSAFNFTGTIVFLGIYNKGSVPVTNDVPVFVFPVPSGAVNTPGSIILDNTFFTQNGINNSNGVSYAVSTVRDKFTDPGTPANYLMNVLYI